MKSATTTVLLLFSLFIFNSCQKTSPEQNAGDSDQLNSTITTETNATAAVFSVSRVFDNNMVIQRDKPASVWGTAPAGHTISVKATWNNSTFTTVSDGVSHWRVMIPAAPANTNPQQLTVTDNSASPITFNNILIGDVWICSGQSNMVMPVDSVSPPYNGYEGVTDYQQEIAAANWPLLRVTSLQTDYESKPLYNLSYPAAWSSCDPNTVKAYSAVAYFFGRKLLTSLNVPIGLVVSAVGGTSCEWWTNKQQIDANPVLSGYYTDYRNSQLYNGMINPLRLMSVKGFIWYQGENNRSDRPVSNYTTLNSAMIKGWRNQFGQGTLPFYFVQMTPFDVNWDKYSEPRDNDYAFFREAQAKVRNVINTGMAVTMDVGDLKRIHPKNKKPVGERLAALALHKTYGIAVADAGPQYVSYTKNNYTATINFVAGTANGLTTVNNAALGQYFFVAGADSILRQATAVISGSKITVTAPAEMPLPIIAVRYAFTNYPVGANLQNDAGLPAEPFRTDKWPQ